MNPKIEFSQLDRRRASVGVGLLSVWIAGQATAVEFDAGFLRGVTATDLRRYEHGETVPEGDITLDVTVNQRWLGRHSVPLRNQGASTQAAPCYGAQLLKSLGVDLQRLAIDTQQRLAESSSCMGLDAFAFTASETLDFSSLQLDLLIAQEVMRQELSDYLPPEQWDSGVTAAFLDYNLNIYQQHDLEQQSATRQGFLGVRAGFNAGQWYWRHDGSWQVSNGQKPVYQPISTSLRRDIPGWSAQLTLGDSYSSGQVFESTTMRGVLLGSDERMLPVEQRGFAPVVSGVANSTALVSIRQRGVLLHESTVAPGPFVIENLLPSAINDELEVTVREADGSVRTSFQAYQGAPLALRPGASRFEIGSGVWRSPLSGSGPGFVQGSWQRGLSNLFSGHLGGWLAEDYQASAMGVAMNTGVGAFGLTALRAVARPVRRKPARGQAWRLSWRHRLGDSGTNLGATFSRSDGPGYYTFEDFASAAEGIRTDSRRWAASLSLAQQFGERGGRVTTSATSNRNWSGRGDRTEYRLSYANHFGTLGYSVDLMREQRGKSASADSLTFTVNMPIDEGRRGGLRSTTRMSPDGRSSSLTYSDTHGDQGEWGHQLTVVDRGGQVSGSGLEAGLQHRGGSGHFNATLSRSRGYRQATLDVQGAVIAHAGGFKTAPPLGESFAIVHAPGAQAARIREHPQVQLDKQGVAVVPSLQPYSINTVELDPKGMPRDVELLDASLTVVPRAGAVSLLRYPTRSGQLIVVLAHNEGRPLPFGAQVFDEDGNEVGMVGQGSRLMLRSSASKDRFKVVWGQSSAAHCWVAFMEKADKEQPSIPCLRVL